MVGGPGAPDDLPAPLIVAHFREVDVSEQRVGVARTSVTASPKWMNRPTLGRQRSLIDASAMDSVQSESVEQRLQVGAYGARHPEWAQPDIT